VAQKKKRKDYIAPNKRQGPPARADKREHRSANRSERAGAKQEHVRRAKRQRLSTPVIALGITGLLAGGYLIFDSRKDAALQGKLTAGGICTTDEKSDPTDPPGQNHVTSPSFAVNPPAGGNHTAGVEKAGELRGEAAANLGPIVHTLEHGYVVLWHRPDLPDDQRKVLTDLADRRSSDILVVERAGMTVPVAATAWGKRLLCTQAQAAPLEAFAAEYIGGGPEDVPRG